VQKLKRYWMELNCKNIEVKELNKGFAPLTNKLLNLTSKPVSPADLASKRGRYTSSLSSSCTKLLNLTSQKGLQLPL